MFFWSVDFLNVLQVTGAEGRGMNASQYMNINFLFSLGVKKGCGREKKS